MPKTISILAEYTKYEYQSLYSKYTTNQLIVSDLKSLVKLFFNILVFIWKSAENIIAIVFEIKGAC